MRILSKFSKKKALEPSEILGLLNSLDSRREDSNVRIAAVDAIGTAKVLPVSGLPVIGSDVNVSDKIIVSFKKILEDKTEDYLLRLQILKTLRKQKAIVSLKAPFIGPKEIDIITTLSDMANDKNEDAYIRKSAIEVFSAIVPYKQD